MSTASADAAGTTEEPAYVEFEIHRVDRTVEEESPDIDTAEIVEWDDESIVEFFESYDEHRTEYPVVHVCGYTTEGEYRHASIVGFEPYCYVPYDEVVDADLSCVKRYELYDEDGEEFRSVRGERVARVVTYTPGDVPDVDDAFETTWESDVLFPQRFITDNRTFTGIRVPDVDRPVHVDEVESCEVDGGWRIHYVDIEVEDRHGFPEGGDEEVLCITAYDSHLDEYITWLQGEGEGEAYTDTSEMHGSEVSVRWFDDELAMLRDYVSFVNGSYPSIITGWNIDDFDIPYLIDRCRVLERERDESINIDAMSPLGTVYYNRYGATVRGVAVLDLLQAYKRRRKTEADSYRLEDVGEDELGVGKTEFVGRVGQLWEDDPVKLLEYNLRDVELCVELDRRQDVISFVREMKSIAGCQLSDAPIESTVCDRYLLKLLYGDVVLPRMSAHAGSDFSGADVFDAFEGIAEMVPLLDLKSLYPMSMLTLNASPETKVDPEVYGGKTRHSPNDIHFRQDEDAIVVQVIEELLEEREKKKAERDEYDHGTDEYESLDLQQYAVKVVMNALYGMMGWSRFRLYDVDVASAVTSTGRAVLQHTGEMVGRLGYSVLYGDTDSVLIDLGGGYERTVEAVLEIGFELEEKIDASYDEFSRETLDAENHRFKIEFEKLYRRFFQGGSKKRYAGHIVWDEGTEVDEIDITGYQYKRSDAPKLGKEVQEQAVKRIVTGEDEADVADYVHEQIDRFERREVNLDDIGVPTGIGKPLYKYDSDTHTTRAAKFGNLVLGTSFAKGSKPKRYYLDSVNPALFERLESEEGFDPGRDRMYAEFKEDPWVIGVTDAAELAGELSLDWERMMKKNLREQLGSIMESLGYSWDELCSGQEQTGLDAFAD